MEISPITGIRVLPAAQAKSEIAGLTSYFYLEQTARPGDDTYSGGEKKAAGAEENDPEDSVEETEVQPIEESPEGSSNGTINYFA